MRRQEAEFILQTTTLWSARRRGSITALDADERTNRHDSSPALCGEVDRATDRTAPAYRPAHGGEVSGETGASAAEIKPTMKICATRPGWEARRRARRNEWYGMRRHFHGRRRRALRHARAKAPTWEAAAWSCNRYCDRAPRRGQPSHSTQTMTGS